jgi:hypothetical protein
MHLAWTNATVRPREPYTLIEVANFNGADPQTRLREEGCGN